MVVSVSDFFDPYDEHAHLERHVKQTLKECADSSGSAHPAVLIQSLEEHYVDLKNVSTELNQQIKTLLSTFDDSGRIFSQKIKDSTNFIEDAGSKFDKINEGISLISTKVNTVGNQMQQLSNPEKRSRQCLEIIKYLQEFMDSSGIPKKYYEKQHLFENCKLICTLLDVVTDLKNPRFAVVQNSIKETFLLLENMLLQTFEESHARSDYETMKKCSQCTSHSSIYQKCYQNMIKNFVQNGIKKSKLFPSIEETFEKCYYVSTKVFENSFNIVMADLTNEIYENVITNHLLEELPNGLSDVGACEKLCQIFLSVQRMEENISAKNITLDQGKLSIHNTQAFEPFLKEYFTRELEFFKIFLETIVESSVPHSKSQTSSSKTSRNKKSEEIAVDDLIPTHLIMNMIQHSRSVVERCQKLSMIQHVEGNVEKLFLQLLQVLGDDLCLHSMSIALEALPPTNPKIPPSLHYIYFVEQMVLIVIFIEKHLTDDIHGILKASPSYKSCHLAFATFMTELEKQIDDGFRRLLCSIVNWTKNTMRAEYVSADFEETNQCVVQSKACKIICTYYMQLIAQLKNSLEKKNYQVFVLELAINLVQILLEHIKNFIFTFDGALNIVNDLNEYKSLFDGCEVTDIESIFATANRLLYLLLMNPSNVADIWFSDELQYVPYEIKKQILQLRVDFGQIDMKALGN